MPNRETWPVVPTPISVRDVSRKSDTIRFVKDTSPTNDPRFWKRSIARTSLCLDAERRNPSSPDSRTRGRCLLHRVLFRLRYYQPCRLFPTISVQRSPCRSRYEHYLIFCIEINLNTQCLAVFKSKTGKNKIEEDASKTYVKSQWYQQYYTINNN